ncbi:hypothetical protein ACFZBU_42930 [Embleya sp. NPDC008237]|uniref:hypothetical protein n=1 Tax=Embleya sp. NPDC008237 TaxID=3363978 RepID=UPI0036E44735
MHLTFQPEWQERSRDASSFDDIVGDGWILMSLLPPDRLPLDAEQRAFLRLLNTRIVYITRAKAPGAVTDLDGDATRWFTEHDAELALVRPDFHVFGAVRADLAGVLVDSLRDRLRRYTPKMPT